MPVQSEAALENGLIDTLQKMNYEYVHIEEEKNLSANFKNLSILKVALALKRQRNCETSFRLKWKAVNACGWSS